MGVTAFMLIAIVAGYSAGLVFEAATLGEDSKLHSLSATGEFTSKWIPYGLAEEIQEAEGYVITHPFGGGPYIFLQNAYLSEEISFDHAKIDFTIAIDQKTDGTFINKVTQCIFETDVDVNTECVVCLFKDEFGNNIAKGEEFFEPPYLANTPLVLEMNMFLNNDPDIIDVQNVHGVELGICKERTGGCTPGFWKQPHHFDSWEMFVPGDFFDDVFGVTSSFGSTFTLLDAASQGGGGEKALARHAVAALLNTKNNEVNYSLTQAEVISLVQDAYSNGDFEAAKEILEEENEQLCPLD